MHPSHARGTPLNRVVGTGRHTHSIPSLMDEDSHASNHARGTLLRPCSRVPAATPTQSPLLDEDDFLIVDVPDCSICTVCKSTRLEPIDNGAFYACLDCGTQVQGVVEEATEAFETSVGWSGRRRSTGGKKKKQKTGEGHVEEMERGPRPSALQVLEAFQHLLQVSLEGLVSRCGCEPQLIDAVRDIWFRCVPLCSDAQQLAEDEESTVLRAPVLLGVMSPERDGGVPVSLGPSLAVALCYLGCLQRALPVRIDDLLAWCSSDDMPLMTAHSSLPERLQPVFWRQSPVVGVLSYTMPSAVSIEAVATAVLRKLELQPPPPRTAAIVQRLGGMLGLPPHVQRLAEAALHHREADLKRPSRGKKRKHGSDGQGRATTLEHGTSDADDTDEWSDSQADERTAAAGARRAPTAASKSRVQARVWRDAAAALIVACKFSYDTTPPLADARPSPTRRHAPASATLQPGPLDASAALG